MAGTGIIAKVWDFRIPMNKVRTYTTDKIIRSSKDPEVRRAINEDIYWEILLGQAPIQTGALDASPAGNYYVGDNHYANGYIDDEGIVYNPYHVSESYPTGYRYGKAAAIKSHFIPSNLISMHELVPIVARHVTQALEEDS